MGLFSRKRLDTNALYVVLGRGTVDDLDAVYDRRWVDRDVFESGTLLEVAMGNKDPLQRVALGNRLLDDGADVRRGRPLHVLLGRNDHDFAAEATLVTRILDAGADVNEVYPKFGTPLETAATRFRFSDADLSPFYDVLLARPDLDLLRASSHGRSVLDNLRRMTLKRSELVARAEQVLRDRGIPVPPEGA